MSEYAHAPVMAAEVIDALMIEGTRADGVFVDATYGRGGHAQMIVARLGDRGRLLVMDKDHDAIAHARDVFGKDKRVLIVHGDFADLPAALTRYGLFGRVNGLLCDLGVSSPQIDTPERGFSFRFDAPLDMRMDQSVSLTAADWLSTATVNDIASVLRSYGEEPRARAIATRIVARRASQPFRMTSDLVDVVVSVKGNGDGRIHPATKVFQAIRMHINNELDALTALLAHSEDALADGGRLAIISFHSLEDRRVKQFIRARTRPLAMPPGLAPPPFTPTFVAVGKYRPDATETICNRRARSATLRVAERRRRLADIPAGTHRSMTVEDEHDAVYYRA